MIRETQFFGSIMHTGGDSISMLIVSSQRGLLFTSYVLKHFYIHNTESIELKIKVHGLCSTDSRIQVSAERIL